MKVNSFHSSRKNKLEFGGSPTSSSRLSFRHSSVDSYVPTILPAQVQVPSTPSTLLSFIVKFALYLSCESNENKQKRLSLAHFKKKTLSLKIRGMVCEGCLENMQYTYICTVLGRFVGGQKCLEKMGRQVRTCEPSYQCRYKWVENFSPLQKYTKMKAKISRETVNIE